MDENQVIFKLFQKTKDKNTMIDVGAHFGGSLEPFAKDNWRIYAFEPDPNNRIKLVKLCKKNNFDNVIISTNAVSDKPQENVPFYSSKVSTGISGLNKFHESHRICLFVDVITLADFIKVNRIEKVNYLKIDTEGYDLFVLKGFPWNKIQPDVILTEFEDSKTTNLGYSYEDMIKYLSDNGYEIIISEWYPIVQYGNQHNWKQLHLYYDGFKGLEDNACGNIIALNKEKYRLNDFLLHFYAEPFFRLDNVGRITLIKHVLKRTFQPKKIQST